MIPIADSLGSWKANRGIVFDKKKPKTISRQTMNRLKHHEIVPIVRIVPGIPKIIDELVRMWRLGSEESSDIPIRYLRSAAFPRKYIDEYRRKGQKQLLHRYCSLISILLQGFDPALSETENCEPSGEKWDLAIEAFKRKWPKMPLPKVINLSRGIGSLKNPRQVTRDLRKCVQRSN